MSLQINPIIGRKTSQLFLNGGRGRSCPEARRESTAHVLDCAIAHGVEHGGWCPKGLRAEDRVIAARYELVETEAKPYCARTKQIVTNSDVTLAINSGALEGGALATIVFTKELEKLYLVVQLHEPPNTAPGFLAHCCGRRE